jgi:hypothetical protein
MRDAEAYRELLSELLLNKVELFGPAILSRARQVPGVVVDSRGNVQSIGDDPFAALEQILASFERFSGRISNVTARGVVGKLRLLERYPDLELPAAIR